MPVLVVDCSGERKELICEVSGRTTLDGKAMEKGTITFIPIPDGKEGVTAHVSGST